ncbi:MAG: cob(I)yrinic acid a,c-diamide adenosyltransferase [Acidimicrobiales bacterium]
MSVVPFVKSGRWNSGEARPLSTLGAGWHVMAQGFAWEATDLGRSAATARSAWDLARRAIVSGDFDLIVPDGATYPINWARMEEADVFAVISRRPAKANVIITGRDAPANLVAVANTVSEMSTLRHTLDAGIGAELGMDL